MALAGRQLQNSDVGVSESDDNAGPLKPGLCTPTYPWRDRHCVEVMAHGRRLVAGDALIVIGLRGRLHSTCDNQSYTFVAAGWLATGIADVKLGTRNLPMQPCSRSVGRGLPLQLSAFPLLYNNLICQYAARPCPSSATSALQSIGLC